VRAALALLLVLTPPATTAAELRLSVEPQRVGAVACLDGAEASGGFTLGLDAALPAALAEPPSSGRFAAAAAPVTDPRPAIDLAAVRQTAVSMRRQAPASGAEPSARAQGSFGKWLKRHWWVPALVGAAVVVATVGESVYDDDEEDDDD